MTIEEKRRLNSRAPISRLPPEVLSSIFSYVQDDYIAALMDKRGFSRPLVDVGSEAWIGLTHICHDWREVALGTAKLWTRVVSSPSRNKWTQELLLRSKSSPLTCIIEGSLDSCDNTRATRGRSELIEQLNRCHTLSMREVTWIDLQKYWPSRVDVPQLEYLIINATDDISFVNPFILSNSHLHAPSLRRLELEGCGVDWKSGFLSRLTHLDLGRLPDDSLLECNDFIKVLANMPFLEEVYLTCRYIRDEDTGVIPFPDNARACPYWHHLRHLFIIDDVSNVARFLNNITLLPKSKLHVNTSDFIHEAGPYLPLVFDWLSNHFKQPAGGSVSGAPHICIRGLILRDSKDAFAIQGFNGFGPEDRFALFNFNFLSFEDEIVGTFGEAFQRILLPLIPISFLVSLNVSLAGFFLSTSCWLTIFGSIPTLESIYVCTDHPQHFFYALLPNYSNAQFRPFEALKSINLFAYMSPINYQAFANILRVRSEHGMRQLEFVSLVAACPPPYDALSQLMGVVSSVGVLFVHESDDE